MLDIVLKSFLTPCWISYRIFRHIVLDIVSFFSIYRVGYRIESFLIQRWISYRYFFPDTAVLDILSFFSIFCVGYRIESPFNINIKLCTMATSNFDVSHRTRFCPPSIPWHPAYFELTRTGRNNFDLWQSPQTHTIFPAGRSDAIHVPQYINQPGVHRVCTYRNGIYQTVFSRRATMEVALLGQISLEYYSGTALPYYNQVSTPRKSRCCP